MSATDVIGTAVLAAIGVVAGAFIGGGWAVLFGLIGMGLGFGVIAAGIRWLVAVPVVIGTTVGAVVGWGITDAVCRPSDCVAAGTVAAILMGIGSFVGVGLVVALATRSFDEYRQAVDGQRPPPTPGGETDEQPSS